MEAQKFTMLNEIDVLKTSPTTLKENRIQATVYKHDIFRFKRFFKESSTLTIVNPSVGLNASNYRVIDCSNKLVLGPNTHVNPCQEFDGWLFGFKMISFESLINKDISLKSTVDIIGHMVHVFKINASNVKDKNKRTMEICDLSGNSVYLTLWDHYASELSKYVIEHFDEGQAIIVLLLALLNGNDVSVRKPIPVKMLSYVDDEFLRATNFFNICDICTIIFPKSIIILGTIKAPRYGMVLHWFKIKIRVQDSTGVVSLTLFDRDAKMLTNKTAKELIDSQNENKVDNGGFPAELDCLLENIFAFKVDVALFKFRNNVEDYGINKLTDDTNLITELQKRHNGLLQSDSNSVTMGASISEFQSSGSVSIKLSDIGDNQTPSSNVDAQDVATDTKGMSTSSDDKLKRKLVEVFEVDDDASMSATKLKFKTIEEMGTTSESCEGVELLTPKVEEESK
ncbi:uncharacterized protein LOC143557801 [Bidens hawaiensis]|uniref:uncharacterized protein LOC143557801 n=1 Tax=Bidens hawaiensis TaxID=980011 RepID=UPI00404B5CB0